MDGSIAIIVGMFGLGLLAVLLCQYNLNQTRQRQRFKDEARFYRKVAETLQTADFRIQLDLGRIILDDVARRQSPALSGEEIDQLTRIINDHLEGMQQLDSRLSDYQARCRYPTCSTVTSLGRVGNEHRKLH